MEYESLIAEFGARYGMADLAPDEDGAVGLAVDGRPMSLQLIPETTIVVATTEVGEVPVAGENSVNRLVAKANRSLFLQDGMALVLHSKDEHYCLLARIDVAQLDFAGFDGKIARFLELADQWRGFLEKFIPLSAEAEASGAPAETPPRDGLSAHMMRV